jgi:hypothetical protein
MTYTILSDRTDKLLWGAGAIVVALLVLRALSLTIMRLERRRAVGKRQLVRLRRGETAAALVATAIPYIAAIAVIILLASAFLPRTAAALGGSALVLILVGFGAQRFLTDVIADGLIAMLGTGNLSVSTRLNLKGERDDINHQTERCGPDTMQVLRQYPQRLRLEKVERPLPQRDEALVEVHAAAITRGELEWRADHLPSVPSHELSGVIVGSGESVFALTPFDRDGVAADYVALPSTILAAKPRNMTHVEAAALPMGGLTAWQGLFVHGRLQAGERVLITGSSGGVGHLAVQLARHAGAIVVQDLPADLVFDTVGREIPVGGRTVTIAAQVPDATYFVVEPDRANWSSSLGSLRRANSCRRSTRRSRSNERAKPSIVWRPTATAGR